MKHLANDHKANSSSTVEHQDTGRLTAEQMAYIKKFIKEAGGVENARRALLALDQIEKAA